MRHKKGILFTLITFLILSSIMLFTKSYITRENELRNSITLAQESSREGLIEEDIISNVFKELLTVQLNNISRKNTVTVSFNHAELADRDYSKFMSNYLSYIENAYMQLTNMRISADFNNTFKIQPYKTIFEIKGNNMSFYFSPPFTNINSIDISLKLGTLRDGTCAQPADDGGNNPIITVNIEDVAGWTCANSQLLSPIEDNNRLNGQQFYLATLDPPGYIEIKFGQVEGTNGIFTVLTSNTTANITQLNVDYDLSATKVFLESGSISINNKTSRIILAQE